MNSWTILTPAEREVITLTVWGATAKMIANATDRTPLTIQTIRRNALAKFANDSVAINSAYMAAELGVAPECSPATRYDFRPRLSVAKKIVAACFLLLSIGQIFDRSAQVVRRVAPRTTTARATRSSRSCRSRRDGDDIFSFDFMTA